MYLIYFGLGQFGVQVPPVPAAILAMTINTGAYTTVIFQAGIQAVDIAQKEGALALGMTYAQTFRHVILPQAFRIVFPPLVNQTISLFLFSAVASTISVPELTHQALYVDSVTWRTFEVFIVTTLLYFACTFLVSMAADMYERTRPAT
jgi:polar amino acid transport system permease protein